MTFMTFETASQTDTRTLKEGRFLRVASEASIKRLAFHISLKTIKNTF
jgi:hypothetical protein